MAISKSQQHYEHILNIASQEFSSNGFKGTTVKAIAEKAKLPKANVLYYFKTKEKLYIKVLEQILTLWNSSFDKATIEDDPAIVLQQYIEEKMKLAQLKPDASKIFALEIINGAPILKPYLEHQQKIWFAERIDVINGWIESGKMSPIEPAYLLFTIWAGCQHYADFSTQVQFLMNKPMSDDEFKLATQTVSHLILSGCGLSSPEQGNNSHKHHGDK